jgi:hypothetical protein
MLTETDLAEYLREIRREVCRYCVEHAPGGPPCAPRGKWCGIEFYLPELIESIQSVRSRWMLPYLRTNRRRICDHCPRRETACCPCPLYSLAPLLVQAVKTVESCRTSLA